MMSTYSIMCSPDTRDDVVRLVSDFSNDVLIDRLEDDRVTITIESDQADSIYNQILEEVGRKVYARQ